MSDCTADLDLLRRYEPVLRFTRGESFFPLDVAAYVRTCSLWVQRPDQPPQQLVPPGQLDLDRLAYPYPDEFGTVHYLKCVEPLGVAELAVEHARWGRGARPQQFHAGRGRLARVGYGSRMLDAFFSISLLARGRVPGDTAAAAELAYRQIWTANETHTYFGRVVRQHKWVILQYWYFYLFNNWRSGFFGANDHEADWEMACIYLSEDESMRPEGVLVQPEWVAYASHDFQGDDLRRHWDDPEVEKIGEHPVIYVGAGSHASYFSQGEYLTEIELPFLAPLVRMTDRIQQFWHKQMRQYASDDTGDAAGRFSNIFRVPFVDYARGDGLAIGPGQAQTWSTPCLLNPTPPWVSQYRGLWGLYTHDPFAGEDAPAGPMYNRDGSVRRAWYDPVGWAGLDKVTPFDELMVQVLVEHQALRIRREQLQTQIDKKTQQLQGLGVRATAIRAQPHLYQLYLNHEEQIDSLGQELDSLRRQLATEEALSEALDRYASQIEAGELGPLRAHIRRGHQPTSAERLRFSRFAEFWAAACIGLMLVIFVALVVFARRYLGFGLAAILAVFTFIEASFRGRLTRLVTSATIGLSLVATLVIIYEFFWPLVISAVLLMGGFILWENLRELWQ
jgi:hypothetical protein